MKLQIKTFFSEKDCNEFLRAIDFKYVQDVKLVYKGEQPIYMVLYKEYIQ